MNVLFAVILFAITPTIPGATNPNVTQADLQSTICVPGYSAQIRPPTSYTTPLKKFLAKAQHVKAANYELDHLVPLSLGGDPRSPNNLWLEPWSQAKKKDKDEVRLHREVCQGKLTLAQAQDQMLSKWGEHVG